MAGNMAGISQKASVEAYDPPIQSGLTDMKSETNTDITMHLKSV